ncbi:MAG: hypothetical protein HOE73_06565 [Bacteroidetes Order II. Incertae sedis bacterium]|jgi:hypothetical protein|nr:hypothetical protein [Bacteroidetes Order II. bacterium]MBT4052737.1 hypothetical protein [Bacteroidetes Order II. bacterium]MBT6199898.1 hypothetical protein [Bacteroidetes Order II. bacterium]MBT6424496.1 hypothetical protein [Bacteroidetes Order II. bacterium]MBT6582346.1 hypothetical protein [Bacteroidetes Order II. bacterium]
MNRIEFTLPDVGLREIEGFVWIEDGYLVLEVTDKLLGLVDTDTNLIKIEPNALADLHIKHRPFKDRLVLSPKKIDLLEAVPGKHVSSVQLKIWKTKRNEVVELVAEFNAIKQPQQTSLPADSSP